MSAADAPSDTWRPYPLHPAGDAHTVVGNIRALERFHSPQLGNHRDLLVYLPPSYERSTKRYPVIYMHDGQNLFDEATSFGEEWRVDNTLDALSPQLEAIVVGVPNTGEHRLDEYSPFEDPKMGGGRADDYLDFLIDTVKPRIDADFRTLTGRDHTAIVGSSMGGLVSLYAFFARSEVFGKAGVMSPSLWFADRAIFRFVEEAATPPGRLYLDVGSLEGEATVHDVRRLLGLLFEKGYGKGRSLKYVEQEGAGHTETAWRKRFRRAVPFLLGAPSATDETP